MNSERNADRLKSTEWSPYRLGYRPGLDGLRGAAILVVLWDHFFDLPLAAGFIGVNTFFVLSGFLITSLLVEEWDESGGISLPAFYARRALRLLPALLFMVLCALIYCRLYHSRRVFPFDLQEAQAAVFYYMNWFLIFEWGRTNLIGHTWSLSFEEQFYLVWPPLLWVLLKFASRRSLLNFIALGIILSCGWRGFLVAIEASHTAGYYRFFFGLDTHADALLVGCGLAVVLASDLLPAIIRWKKTLAALALVSTIFTAVTLGAIPINTNGMYFFGWLVLSLCAGAIVLGVALNSAGIIQRVLESPLLVYAGKLSYSLYLWHFPVLRVLHERNLSDQKIILFGLGATVPLSLFSYYCVERPCLRLKHRFAKVKKTS